MDYVSYFRFFESVYQIIHDVELDFTTGNLSGEVFDSEYKSFMHKLTGHCQKYKKTIFRESSSYFLSAYVSDINSVHSYPQKDRFEKLLSITKDYMKKSV